jgi:hypothetical protein
MPTRAALLIAGLRSTRPTGPRLSSVASPASGSISIQLPSDLSERWMWAAAPHRIAGQASHMQRPGRIVAKPATLPRRDHVSAIATGRSDRRRDTNHSQCRAAIRAQRAEVKRTRGELGHSVTIDPIQTSALSRRNRNCNTVWAAGLPLYLNQRECDIERSVRGARSPCGL